MDARRCRRPTRTRPPPCSDLPRDPTVGNRGDLFVPTCRHADVHRSVQSWLGNLPRYQPEIMALSEAGSTTNTRITCTMRNPVKIHTAQKCQYRAAWKP